MVEVAETAKTAWPSLTVWQFFMKRAKEASIIARVSLDVGFRELKNALWSSNRKSGKFASYQRGVWDSRDSWPLRYWRIDSSKLALDVLRGKGFGLFVFCFFSHFQELFLLELVSCWADLPKDYFQWKFAKNLPTTKILKKNMDIWCINAWDN